ncbi:MAG: PilZ domain-containing protein [bacterium]
MKKRPPIVLLFTVLCAVYPLLIIFQNLMTLPGGAGQAVRSFGWSPNPLLLPAENLLATALAWFAAYAVYRMKAWSWWLAVLAAVTLLAFGVGVSLFRAPDTGDAWLWTSTFVMALPAVAAAALLQKEIRAPYFNPRIRWWESEKRFPFDATVVGVGQGVGAGAALDISRRGLFVQQDNPPKQGVAGEYVFEVDGREIRVNGEVSWISEGDAAHPTGFGLRFTELDTETRRVIDELVARQARLGDKQWGEREVRYPSDIRCDDGSTVLDISLGGMFVRTDEKRKLGDAVQYRLRFGRHDFAVHGKVVWVSPGDGVHPSGHGVRFVGLDPDTRAMVRLAVEDLWKASREPLERQH